MYPSTPFIPLNAYDMPVSSLTACSISPIFLGLIEMLGSRKNPQAS